MKKFFNVLIILSILVFASEKVCSIQFNDGIAQSSQKPFMVLLYANWANDYDQYLGVFRTTQSLLANRFNYLELNVSDEDMAFFNQKYVLYQNVPYILMFRSNGKISSYIDNNCAKDTACIIDKAKRFIRE